MKFLLKNQLGFSLVQGMIIAAVVAGSSLVATRLITDQKLAHQGAESRDRVEELHDLIYTVLQNKSHCKATIDANGASTVLGSSPGSANLTTIVTAAPANQTVARVYNPADPINTVYMNNSVSIESMALNFSNPANGQGTLNIRYNRLENTTNSKRTKTGYGGKSFQKTLPIRIQRDPTTTNFISCYVFSNADADSSNTGNDLTKEFCANYPFLEWNESLSVCRPKATCPAGQIYTGIDSTGVLKCRDLLDWFNFEKVVDPTIPSTCPAGYKVRFEVYNSGGGTRVRIICTP